MAAEEWRTAEHVVRYLARRAPIRTAAKATLPCPSPCPARLAGSSTQAPATGVCSRCSTAIVPLPALGGFDAVVSSFASNTSSVRPTTFAGGTSDLVHSATPAALV